MVFTLTEDQRDFQSSVRSFATARSTMEDVRRVMATESGYDLGVWRQMAEQLGLQGLTIPERYGGSGFGPREAAIVFEELGRTLLCAPYFSTVALAANALLAIDDDEARSDLLPGIADGTMIATLAIAEQDGRFDEASITTEARPSAGGYALHGVKAFVTDGATADLLLVVARAPEGVSLFAVDANAQGVRRDPAQTLDETRKQAWLTFTGAPARLLGVPGRAWPAVRRTLDLTASALAAEQVGGLSAVLEMSVAYAKERVQFGRPIGSFQAIKHKCADMLVALESARSAAAYAAWAAADEPNELPAAAALAKAYCSDAYIGAAKQTIQIHGGIGFTWEHDAHLHLRRAKSSELLLGSPAQHRDVLAHSMGL